MFYAEVFGVREYFRDQRQIQVQGPGRYDVLAFEKGEANAGFADGIGRFGFRLTNASDINAIVEIGAWGDRLLRRGKFSPGFPFAYVADPDGYEIEIWFE